MRLILIATAAAVLLVPAATPTALALNTGVTASKTFDLSAAKKKKEKVEYMKSAAGPAPKAVKAKKKKKK